MCVLISGKDVGTGPRNRSTGMVNSIDQKHPHRESEATPPSLSMSVLADSPARYLQGKGWVRTAVKTTEENQRYKSSLSIF